MDAHFLHCSLEEWPSEKGGPWKREGKMAPVESQDNMGYLIHFGFGDLLAFVHALVIGTTNLFCLYLLQNRKLQELSLVAHLTIHGTTIPFRHSLRKDVAARILSCGILAQQETK